MQYKDLDALRGAVEANGGLLTIGMSDLRDTFGARRLGVHIRDTITMQLRSAGLSHFPPELPNSQLAGVKIFFTESPVGEVVEALMSPDPANDKVILTSIRKKPGRPAGSAVISASSEGGDENGTDAEAEVSNPPKRRGRPRKNPEPATV